MTADEIKMLQQSLLEQGFYTGKIDGVRGPQTILAENNAAHALSQRTKAQVPGLPVHQHKPLAWGARVTPRFRERVLAICMYLGIPDPDWLMACMAFESGESFSPNVVNGAGSGAVGLIQFMPATAKALWTTTEALGKMTAEEQLDYVYKYFLPYAGRFRTLSDVYMAILWPAAIGRPDSAVLWSQDSKPTTYRQNAGLDVDRDLTITKGEAASKVEAKLVKGRSFYAR